MQNPTRILFPQGFDDRAADEMTMKGYANILIELDEGQYYSVWFFDPIRAQQELEQSTQSGHPYFTEQGALVLVSEVTVDAVLNTVRSILKHGYHSYWKAGPPDDAFNPKERGKYDRVLTD
jgi:hypothetical protein